MCLMSSLVHVTRQAGEVFVLLKALADQHLCPIQNSSSGFFSFLQEPGVLWCVDGIKH